ncbi:Anthranilate synthase component II [Piscirickettsia salmonis]|uniref:Glutamine amidotransferase of anthranilate synthase/aminodeoxychorismate synthase family protein n=1 Tax=Piscirickettsia salmonis TaxID=1238 RepID=A0A1L6TDV6_PISSA|nr:aminodeoxychorismate/anthranilate synthase component II [Piscirickettsia salmonis]AKP74627.1 anthranilate synthase [Piscirickettsia salmonis LF-89 = ATCC VR-1361]ALB23629.1 glutamine amidotransferase of anthranilate synthase/aminodeoxychorismate synthase family protein [Piscirickettsia salmonis]ALY03493.1 anthranilate synthase [Piscirickettsia salmonis]AMA43058.1 anthranilate synthase [Piscirickettsia salmonis]AOS35527.1 anthranilate synthase [Piscirickettsia salmonis]
MLVVIDNYDSFTYNLVQYLAKLGADVRVFRNDQITLSELIALDPRHIVISPGPCTPNESGISLEVISYYTGKIPVLGVCLGHQALGQCLGARVEPAPYVMHGKTSEIWHTQQGLFKTLPRRFFVTRYHSLIVAEESLPECLEAVAWCKNKGSGRLIMAMQHKEYPLYGVQFHPEAVLTEYGYELLAQFLMQ